MVGCVRARPGVAGGGQAARGLGGEGEGEGCECSCNVWRAVGCGVSVGSIRARPLPAPATVQSPQALRLSTPSLVFYSSH